MSQVSTIGYECVRGMAAVICKVEEDRANCKGIVVEGANFGAESRWCKGRSVSAHRCVFMPLTLISCPSFAGARVTVVLVHQRQPDKECHAKWGRAGRFDLRCCEVAIGSPIKDVLQL